MLLSKVIWPADHTPYGGASVTGLTNLLYEVLASTYSFSLQPVYPVSPLLTEYNLQKDNHSYHLLFIC